MLTIRGPQFSCCDGIRRRDLLKVGALGLGSLTLPQLLAYRARAAQEGRPIGHRSVVFVELAGGPTHIETYDPKPNAPAEYRGPFGTVATSTPGVHFSALMERQAAAFDKLSVIRSIHHKSSSHGTSSHYTQTGYYLSDRQNRINEMPCIGSVAARLLGSGVSGIPAYISLQRTMRYGTAGYLGKAYNPFEVRSDPSRGNFSVNNLGLDKRLSLERLGYRKDLLSRIDAQRAILDTQGVSEAIDKFTGEAFDMVTSGRAREAFDIEQEDDATRDEYGRNRFGQEMLLARRLIEAGVTFVTIRSGGWDDHNQIDKRMKQKGPDFDRGVAALVEDLHRRGMSDEVLVVAMGEFGRTPRVNKRAGRDHWGRLMSVMLAGGGYRMGQAIGTSNHKGEEPKDRPYTPENVLEMVYRHLGIDTHTTFPDLSGRPRYLLEDHTPISELL